MELSTLYPERESILCVGKSISLLYYHDFLVLLSLTHSLYPPPLVLRDVCTPLYLHSVQTYVPYLSLRGTDADDVERCMHR